MKRVILWFRQDLRLADNSALDFACQAQQTEQVIPVFIWDPELEWGPQGAQKVWLHHSLQSLAEDLKAKGSRLILRQGDTEVVLSELIESFQADTVVWNRCYEPAVIARDKSIKAKLKDQGVAAHSFNGSLLFEPWEVKTQGGGPYKVFTPFWKNCLAQDRPFERFPEPEHLPAVVSQGESETLEDLKLLPAVNWHTEIEKFWQVGEAAAHDKLSHFLSRDVSDYHDQRNTPSVDGTSLLSPHLHFGELSPRQVWHAAQNYPSTEGCRVFLSEIGWREFAYHIMYHFPHTVTQPMDARFEAFPWKPDNGELALWQKGQTGYPIVDAGMRQLWETGWMHNRVRMIVASFLTKDLLLPWQLGAQWFWDTLVDADLASNSMGWQWAAGSGADAAPFFRIFNPVSQGEKFDKEGRYVRRWVPEIAQLPNKYLHKPWEAPPLTLLEAGIVLGRDYPEPVVNHKVAREDALAAFASIKKK